MLAALAATIVMQQSPHRPPAVPLFVHDPYVSVWSFTDRLTDDWPKHWTGKNHGMAGMLRVDGVAYRWMSPADRTSPPAEQTLLQVLPSRTVYSFKAAGVSLKVEFVGQADVRDPAALSRTTTQVDFQAESLDGQDHQVELYLDCSGELVVDVPSQPVSWSRVRSNGRDVLAMWHSAGKPLDRTGDDHRIDWGRLYLAGSGGTTIFGRSQEVRRRFATTGSLSGDDDTRHPRPASDGWPVMAWASGPLMVGKEPASASTTLYYDDDKAIEYFGRPLEAAWRSGSSGPQEGLVLSKPAWDVDSLADEWRRVGGEGYARLATLAYRQALAAHKIVRDIDGTLLMFSKENFSNGCIGTVDVMYPASPLFLACNPELLRANMEPVLQYASMPRWKWPFAPHDLGQYPKANGQVYGGGERSEDDQMPVEESGNMLIMAAAYLHQGGDQVWVKKYWPLYTRWAEYLAEHGVEPGHQLCTDDFGGHLANNANLSVKAIVGMACYARMCEKLGLSDEGKRWSVRAKEGAERWMKLAEDDGHTRLAFDRPGTWSQKYNLVWDKVLGLGLFSQAVYEREVAWYLGRQNLYGLPLDNRADYTKLDWVVWTACLASRREDFDAIMAPVYRWVEETPDRVPLTDWYDTKTGRCVGFRARSVVGGVFMPLLLPR
ncbi:MAG: DUF4965 domain-containing protein [Fimbriimonadaceae bacterium]|nr:DUF4965 domain-containing protein [Fimbriimonadaceae bacterium]QYK58939.1 MAG: DUF4965 domain-containing protein [Fimbriimonadaceae bacterium]